MGKVTGYLHKNVFEIVIGRLNSVFVYIFEEFFYEQLYLINIKMLKPSRLISRIQLIHVKI